MATVEISEPATSRVPQVRKARRTRASDRPLHQNRWMTRFWNTLALGFAVVMGFPIYWMVLTTVKSNTDLLKQNPTFWPTHFDFSSYTTIFDDPNFLPDLENTALITLGAVVLGLLVGFLAAVAVARFRFRGRNFFIVSMLVVQMVPLLSLVIPMFLILKSAGLYDELFGVIIAYLVFTIPYVVWTLRSFIVNIPQELDEAAMVDGCTRWGAFFRVVLPLTVPGLITTGVYCWIQAWNEAHLVRRLPHPQRRLRLADGRRADGLAPRDHPLRHLPEARGLRSDRRCGQGLNHRQSPLVRT